MKKDVSKYNLSDKYEYKWVEAHTYTFADGTEIWQVGRLTGRYKTAEIKEHGSIVKVATETYPLNMGLKRQ